MQKLKNTINKKEINAGNIVYDVDLITSNRDMYSEISISKDDQYEYKYNNDEKN
jgi:hypothetical protein